MNTSEILDVVKKGSTDENGDFDKNMFRVLVAMMFLGQPSEIREKDEVISEYNKGICQILGSGHSLPSCLQFLSGKKAKPYLSELKSEVAKLNFKLA